MSKLKTIPAKESTHPLRTEYNRIKTWSTAISNSMWSITTTDGGSYYWRYVDGSWLWSINGRPLWNALNGITVSNWSSIWSDSFQWHITATRLSTQQEVAILIDNLPFDTLEQKQIKSLAQDNREELKRILFPKKIEWAT